MLTVDRLEPLCIGREADGKVLHVEIDCSAWINEYPNLTRYRVEVTSTSGVVYFPDTHMDGNILVWPITQADTSEKGRGTYQVVATGEDGSRKTSDHPQLIVLSIMEGTAQDSPPDPSEPWTDKVRESAERAEAAAERAEEASEGIVVSPDDIKDAVNEYLAENPVQVEETDPTVPDWAKAESKPTYTAEEVGAQPAGDYALKDEIPEAYTLPVATADTLGGVKVGSGLHMDGDVLSVIGGGVSLSDMRVIETITVEEETTSLYVDFDSACKMCRFYIELPESSGSAWYMYANVKTGKKINGVSNEGYGNPCGSVINSAKFIDYIRIASARRPISAFSSTTSEGNEVTANLKYGMPKKEAITLDETDGFLGIMFSTIDGNFPVGTVITVLGA